MKGALLDQRLLRKSLARITQTHLFNELQSPDVVIQRNDADIKVRLTARGISQGQWARPASPAPSRRR